jgi:hypothetical protein
MPGVARTVVWLARVAWLAVAIFGGAAVGAALDDHSRAVQVAGTDVQASAYGAEARFGLRPPIGYLVACVASWLVASTAVVLAVPALAGGAWALGAACVVVAVGGLAVLPRRWHQLSRRWLVLVPAGLVVHDPVVLADTLMMPQRIVSAVALADRRTPTPAADLTGPTPGLAVEIALSTPVPAVLAPTPARPDGTALRIAALVVSPTRPGAALDAVGKAGYSTG